MSQLILQFMVYKKIAIKIGFKLSFIFEILSFYSKSFLNFSSHFFLHKYYICIPNVTTF